MSDIPPPDDLRDPSDEVQPNIATDPQTTGSTGVEKPTVHVDMDKARKAEEEGKGF